MSGEGKGTLDTGLTEERAALASVLDSSTFKKSPNLARFLSYICEQYFSGDAQRLKEYSIAVDVFGRPESFTPAEDSIVRVEAHRLRKKLRSFYSGEGSDETLEISIATGQYVPRFVPRTRVTANPENGDEQAKPAIVAKPVEQIAFEADQVPAEVPLTEVPVTVHNHLAAESRAAAKPQAHRSTMARWIAGLSMSAGFFLLFGLIAFHRSEGGVAASRGTPENTFDSLPAGGTPEVRIRCGYSKGSYHDYKGNLWLSDRYFSGGIPIQLSNQYIAGTRDQQLYLTMRSGTFSYSIPTPPGTYELHLHFSETTYSPASTLGGGENSRVFNVLLNGQPLLNEFDIISDAGSGTADVRVFRDVHPDATGHVRLDFSGLISQPTLNAIELLPGIPGRIHPIHLVAQNAFFTDSSGQVWEPDNYVIGGVLASDKVTVMGADDPGLYIAQRYGNFTYAIPVDRGSYTARLYFAETYFGTAISGTGGPGHRVFDIFSNGVALARNVDIAKEAGIAHGLVKTFHGLTPNPQGKLVLAFRPDQNYAAVNAISVEQENN
jgi:hypothetical protein